MSVLCDKIVWMVIWAKCVHNTFGHNVVIMFGHKMLSFPITFIVIINNNYWVRKRLKMFEENHKVNNRHCDWQTIDLLYNLLHNYSIQLTIQIFTYKIWFKLFDVHRLLCPFTWIRNVESLKVTVKSQTRITFLCHMKLQLFLSFFICFFVCSF